MVVVDRWYLLTGKFVGFVDRWYLLAGKFMGFVDRWYLLTEQSYLYIGIWITMNVVFFQRYSFSTGLTVPMLYI